ncbi:hypothetical protein BATDEDRAFT_28365 [Batrachochytrium dendrobatidis JAM81]|uniref:Vezatin n=1 Tax=Batrachochytrium dendrobatidis (strain JAM81 / FGSC 10211) TaxID=684364 RepID=F4PDT0_BATDJ|nr:uncharacterized protein BATDEDRAFT_28365 [Batrachochytrium dendrobatidis JAM81]EGF76555.1 hypothetical protein BATDEDRAFT_28365 [Batrachochytrium dendrobatidis JAM81]|eukprot:XP_006682789.1 hypothetical protein BATDEDRAFT_28365 [Batrachochytrium dendrobatidis JAM81]
MNSYYAQENVLFTGTPMEEYLLEFNIDEAHEAIDPILANHDSVALNHHSKLLSLPSWPRILWNGFNGLYFVALHSWRTISNSFGFNYPTVLTSDHIAFRSYYESILKRLIVSQIYLVHGQYSELEYTTDSKPIHLYGSSLWLGHLAAGITTLSLGLFTGARYTSLSKTAIHSIMSIGVAYLCLKSSFNVKYMDILRKTIHRQLLDITDNVKLYTRSMQNAFRYIQDIETMARGYRLGAIHGSTICRVERSSNIRHCLKLRRSIFDIVQYEYQAIYNIISPEICLEFDQDLQKSICIEERFSLVSLKQYLAGLYELRIKLLDVWLTSGLSALNKDSYEIYIKEMLELSQSMNHYLCLIQKAIGDLSSAEQTRIDTEDMVDDWSDAISTLDLLSKELNQLSHECAATAQEITGSNIDHLNSNTAQCMHDENLNDVTKQDISQDEHEDVIQLNDTFDSLSTQMVAIGEMFDSETLMESKADEMDIKPIMSREERIVHRKQQLAIEAKQRAKAVSQFEVMAELTNVLAVRKEAKAVHPQ